MVDGVDRMTRAGNYVLGLMDDDERERAERDLERDGDFRDAVVEIAERMHMFDITASPETLPRTMWKAVSARIADMPQMRAASPGDNKADIPSRPIIQPEGTKAIWRGPHSVGGSRGLLMAAALIAAFALGYLAANLERHKRPARQRQAFHGGSRTIWRMSSGNAALELNRG